MNPVLYLGLASASSVSVTQKPREIRGIPFISKNEGAKELLSI
jgi:hypothetical protein